MPPNKPVLPTPLRGPADRQGVQRAERGAQDGAQRCPVFWEEYQATLFAHQDALDRASLERYAEDLGLGRRRFLAALEDTHLDALLAADEAEAVRLEIEGTPTFFVNGRRVIGAQPLARLRVPVDEALSRRWRCPRSSPREPPPPGRRPSLTAS